MWRLMMIDEGKEREQCCEEMGEGERERERAQKEQAKGAGNFHLSSTWAKSPELEALPLGFCSKIFDN